MAGKTKRFKVSDQSENSYGLVVLTAGGDFTDFEDNPVMLHLHEQKLLIGNWKDLKVEGEDITAEPVFNLKNEYAAARAQEVEDGFLKGASIGIEPIEFSAGEKFGFEGLIVVSKWKLKEISLCPVPSNANALVLYNSKGIKMTEADIKEIKLSIQNQNTTEMKNRAALIAALKLSADATDEQILDAVNKQNSQLEEANTAAQTAKEQALTEKINLMVDTAEKDKKITAEQKPDFVKLAKLDFDGTKKILDSMKPVAGKPIELVHTNNNDKPEGVKGRETWTYDDWATKDTKGLQLMKKDEPEKFNTLLNAAKEAKRRG